MPVRRLATFAFAVFFAASATLAAADWPQWRGPRRDGQIDVAAWPDSLQGERLQQIWRSELGPSYSGPIVVGDRVFTTETRDKKTEATICFERTSGKRLWRVEWEGALSVPFFAWSNGSWIRATPACDGRRLFVAGMRDLLVCLDVVDGRELWRVDFVASLKTPLPSFGFVSSPLIDGEFVYVQAGASLVKLEAATGRIVWRTLEDGGGMEGSAFSSPLMTSLSGRRQLVVQTRKKLAGVDPESGAALWSQEVPAFRGMNILTPVVHGRNVLTSAYGGRTFSYAVAEKESRWDVAVGWENKVQGYMSTPVVIDGHAYLHLRNQRFVCLDLATGKETWTTGKTFGKYWSLVANGSRILALDERGELLLIDADPKEYRLLDSRRVSDDESWAHLAICDDLLFVRELNALAVHRWTRP